MQNVNLVSKDDQILQNGVKSRSELQMCVTSYFLPASPMCHAVLLWYEAESVTKGGDNNNRIEMSNLSIALSDKIVIINTFAFTAIKKLCYIGDITDWRNLAWHSGSTYGVYRMRRWDVRTFLCNIYTETPQWERHLASWTAVLSERIKDRFCQNLFVGDRGKER